mgnify:CR=1 FL=1
MKHTYLHDVLPFLRELEREKQKQFEASVFPYCAIMAYGPVSE